VKPIHITVFKCLLSIAILGYLIYTATQNDQFTKLISPETNWWWVVVGLVACVLAHVVGYVRWQLMVTAIGLPFGLLDAVRIGFIGTFFNLFAFGPVGGDVFRAIHVTREFRNRKAEAIASVVADRLIGLIAMFLIAAVAFWFLDAAELRTAHPQKWAAILVVWQLVNVLTVLSVITMSVLLFTKRLGKKPWFKRLLNLRLVGPFLKSVFNVVSVYRNRSGVLVATFALSLLVNMFFLISIYSIAVGLLSDAPGLIDHLVIEPIAMVSNAIPFPGGLGGMELALHLMYQAFNCDHGVVVAFTFRSCLLIVSAIGAVVWFFNRGQVLSDQTA